jgi:hypothetical protein
VSRKRTVTTDGNGSAPGIDRQRAVAGQLRTVEG